ncbi:MAG TPA: hypothetical protein VE715_06920 [Blastocatellia bacterium]|nr:hypothetical protein [Blastocatellia bacterium]
MAGLLVLGEQSRPSGATHAAIGYWACARAPGVPTTVPPGVKERFRGRVGAMTEEETKAVPAHATGRFEAAAMMDARRFAAVSCRATADQAGGSLAAVSCHVTANRAGASLDDPLICVALRAARRSDDLADRDVAGRHRIAFRRAKAVRYAAARRRFLWPAQSRVHVGYGLSLLTLLTLLAPLALWDVGAGRRHAQPVCNRACARAVRHDRLESAWALTGSDRRLVRLAQTSSGRLDLLFHGSGVSRASPRRPGFGEI